MNLVANHLVVTMITSNIMYYFVTIFIGTHHFLAGSLCGVNIQGVKKYKTEAGIFLLPMLKYYSVWCDN